MDKYRDSRGRLAQWKTVRFIIFVQGDRGLNLAEDFTFLTRSFRFEFSHKCLTAISTIGRVTSSLTQP